MWTYLVRRVLQLIPVLLGLTFVVYALIQLAPGDPIDMLLLDPDYTMDDVDRLKRVYGLDQPMPVQYIKWVLKIVQGDLGYSRTYHQPVTELLAPRLKNTLVLAVPTLCWAVLVSVLLGVYSALHQYSWIDYVSTFVAFVGLAMPVFWFGLMLMMLFSVQLGWLPPGGMAPLGKEHVTLWDRLRYFILPSFVLGFVSMAGWTRYSRAFVLEVLGQDYIRTARAKGLPERLVFWRHMLRNCLIPFITLLSFRIPWLVSGATITETVFSWPGMGQFLYQSIMSNDYNVAMATLMMLALLVIFSNLLADILYAVVDPRIRYS